MNFPEYLREKIKYIQTRPGVKVKRLTMNIMMFSQFRMCPDLTFDPVTQREVLETGYCGSIDGIPVHVTTRIPRMVIEFTTNEGTVNVDFSSCVS